MAARDRAAALREYVASGNEAGVIALLSDGPSNLYLDIGDVEGRTAVFLACEGGHDHALQALIEAHADVNLSRLPEDEGGADPKRKTVSADGSGPSPLHVACQHGHPNCVQMLIDHGADVNARTNKARTPVFNAARFGNASCLRKLLKAGGNVDMPNLYEQTPTFVAAEEGRTECLQLLIDAKADINKPDFAGRTPVFISCVADMPESLEVLVKASANLTHPSNNGRTPLWISRATRHYDTAALIALATLEIEIDTDLSNEEGDRGDKWLYALPNSTPLSHLVHDVFEMKATTHGDKLIAALPYAFARRPVDTCHAVTALVTAYRAESDIVMKSDEKGASELLDAAFRVQTMLIALFETCNDLEFERLTQPPHGDCTILEKAVASECKMLLAYPRLQKSIDFRWSLETPSLVHEFAQKQWFSQGVPGEIVEKGKPPQRITPAPSLLYLTAQFTLAFFLNTLAIIITAFWPPAEAWYDKQRVEMIEQARKRVWARNPAPSDGDDGFDEQGAKYYYLDGVLIATALQTRTAAERAKKKKRWLQMLTTVADEEGRLAELWFPILQPAGKFYLQTGFKLMFACLTTVLDGPGRSSALYLLFLVQWGLQLLIQEITKVIQHPSLWASDVFAFVQLASCVLMVAGLSFRLHIQAKVTGLSDSIAEGDWTDFDVWTRLGKHMEPEDYIRVPHWEAPFAQMLLALGVGLQWASNWCRLLQRTASFGPLILMLLEMIKDVSRFIVMLSGLFLAFAVILVILYQGEHVGDTANLGNECQFLMANEEGSLSAVGETLVALLEIMLGGGPDMSSCLHSSAQSVSAPLVMDIYRMIVILLSLNMLIAQLTTTYDRIKERLATNFMFLTAMIILNALYDDLVPAPLRIFGLPYHTGKRCYKVVSWFESNKEEIVRRASLWGGAYSRLGNVLAFNQKDVKPTLPALHGAAAELRRQVEVYLEVSGGEEAAQDERWRMRQAKQLAAIQRDVADLGTSRIANIEEMQREQQRKLTEILRQNKKVMQAMGLSSASAPSAAKAGKMPVSKPLPPTKSYGSEMEA